MKDLRYLKKYSVPVPEVCLSKGQGDIDRRYNGAFIFSIDGKEVHVLAGRGRGWDHVSVSCEDRCPTWTEMGKVKRVFFEDDEVVMQLHVAVKDHINNHEYTLHLWRPISKLRKIPLPPKELV